MLDPIRHVVLLALENRSFDQMLGNLNEEFPDLEGVSSANTNISGELDDPPYHQAPTRVRVLKEDSDPGHELEHVLRQLSDHNGGFVRDYVAKFPSSTRDERQLIMSYYPAGFLPAMHALARDFTICDHWFSSVPGPTWANRFFMLSGTANGRIHMPQKSWRRSHWRNFLNQDQDTIFDRLNERGIDWRVYFHDVPQSSALRNQQLARNAARYFSFGQFIADSLRPADEFPAFCLIEPSYYGADKNDDHPPHDVMHAEQLIADVYNALRRNPKLWADTLLIVVFDEHGGFYDHVEPPPGAVAPDNRQDEYSFDKLGVRVPALLISPWVGRRVEKATFDHTSILKYLIDKWDLRSLGLRAELATSIGVALRPDWRGDDDYVARIDLLGEELRTLDIDVGEAAPPNDNQNALGQIAKYWIREHIPRVYSSVARGIDAVAGLLERSMDWLPWNRGRLSVSMTEPDKIARTSTRERDSFARELRQKKMDALRVVARRLSDRNLPEQEQAHDIRTLSLMTGIRFHLEENGYETAMRWLEKKRLLS